MWITKLLRSFNRDLDNGLTRLRGKTLRHETHGAVSQAPSIGSGDVRIWRGGKSRSPQDANNDESE